MFYDQEEETTNKVLREPISNQMSDKKKKELAADVLKGEMWPRMSYKVKNKLALHVLEGSLTEREIESLRQWELRDDMVKEYRKTISEAKEYMERLYGPDLSELQESGCARMSIEI